MILLRSLLWTTASLLTSAATAAIAAAVLIAPFRALTRWHWGRALAFASTPLLTGIGLLAAPALALLAGFALVRFNLLAAADLFGPAGEMQATLIKMLVVGVSAAPLPAMAATKAAIYHSGQGAALNAARRSAGFWLAGLLVAEAVLSAPGLGSMLPDAVARSPLLALSTGAILIGLTARIMPTDDALSPGTREVSGFIRPVLFGLAALAGAALLALTLAGPLTGAGLYPAADTSLLNQPPEIVGRLGTDRAGRDVIGVLGMAAGNSLQQAGVAGLLAALLGIAWRRFDSPLRHLDTAPRLKAAFSPALWPLILYPVLPDAASRVALIGLLLALSAPADLFRAGSIRDVTGPVLRLMTAAFAALLLLDVLAGGITLGGLVAQFDELAAGVNVVRGAGYYGLALWYGITALAAGAALGILTDAVVGSARFTYTPREDTSHPSDSILRF